MTGTDPQAVAAALARADRLSRVLDSSFKIPGTRIRFGLDAIVGLIPGVGDLIGLGASAYLLREARQFALPRRVYATMACNLLLEAGIGTIPILGDIFDVAWKANRRNVKLIQKHLERRTAAATGDTRATGAADRARPSSAAQSAES